MSKGILITKVIKLFLDKDYRFIYLAERGKYVNMSDYDFIVRMYKARFKTSLNLKNPVKYTEKIQWLKLYDHNPLYTKLVDKHEVKSYVADLIGDDYIIPTLGVYEAFDDIDFSSFPNQFVIKCTHDSGGVVICKDKKSFDKKKAKKIIERSLKRSFYSIWREWPYKDVKPRIIVERYMEDTEYKELRDYKFFVFNGQVKSLFIASDRQTPNEETKFDFFDEEFNHLPFQNGHPNSTIQPKKPANFNLMKMLAEKLGKEFPHVRVDFYEVNGKVYFGELTFYHWSGFVPFTPSSWDEIWGKWLTLPDKD